MRDRPKYLSGRGLLRRPRKLPAHEKGASGFMFPGMFGPQFVSWEDAHRATGGWMARYDCLSPADRKRIQERGK